MHNNSAKLSVYYVKQAEDEIELILIFPGDSVPRDFFIIFTFDI